MVETRRGGEKRGEKGEKGGREQRKTLEMTACKYANGGPLKWRWRGGRIKSSEHCVIMDQFAAIKPPYGWSLWNGEISAPQGQLWWQWRSQTMGATEGDTLTEENKLRWDGKTGRQSVLNISIQARPEGLSNYVNSERWWCGPLAIAEQRAEGYGCDLRCCWDGK